MKTTTLTKEQKFFIALVAYAEDVLDSMKIPYTEFTFTFVLEQGGVVSLGFENVWKIAVIPMLSYYPFPKDSFNKEKYKFFKWWKTLSEDEQILFIDKSNEGHSCPQCKEELKETLN